MVKNTLYWSIHFSVSPQDLLQWYFYFTVLWIKNIKINKNNIIIKIFRKQARGHHEMQLVIKLITILDKSLFCIAILCCVVLLYYLYNNYCHTNTGRDLVVFFYSRNICLVRQDILVITFYIFTVSNNSEKWYQPCHKHLVLSQYFACMKECY